MLEYKANEETQVGTEIPLEKVRGILAEKSRSGHTAEVRSILRHGADRLSDIDPKITPQYSRTRRCCDGEAFHTIAFRIAPVAELYTVRKA